MAEVIFLLQIIINLLSLIFLATTLYYIKEVRKFTKGFKRIWNYIILGLAFLIILSLLNFFIFDSRSLVNSLLILIASLFFSYGFFKLSNIFKEISHRNNFQYKVKKQLYLMHQEILGSYIVLALISESYYISYFYYLYYYYYP